jgi:putative intracellular protease/amidase
MERTVALKVIDSRVLGHPSAAARFLVEVKAAAKLDHPNIVRAYDAEQAGSTHFLVMEYVDGVSLASLVRRRGPLPVPQACQCIRQAALGLQHAADHGMVHRDIKPENLMLTRRGQVKILDFGLARLAREAPTNTDYRGRPTPVSASSLTSVGAVLGTPAYIAPEQARDSGDVDIRADIFSLGCTLRFLLGLEVRPPGAAQPVRDATTATSAVSGPLIRVIDRMTAIDVADRFSSPGEVAEALAPFCGKSSAVPTSPTTKAIWRRRNALAVAAAVAALAAGTWWIIAGRDSHTRSAGSSPASAGPSVAQRAAIAGRPSVLVVLPPRYYRDDYARVRAVLEQSGVRVVVASVGPCTVEGPGGPGMVDPDVRIDRMTPDTTDYDAVYFPGGLIAPYKDEGPARQLVWTLIDRMAAAGKPVAALGHGQGVLAVRGVLADRTVAASDQLRGWMPGYAGRLAPGRVAVDGPYVTGSESSDADALAATLVNLLQQR